MGLQNGLTASVSAGRIIFDFHGTSFFYCIKNFVI